ncbi:MAG: hypothetical protein H6Q67_1056 [Firmicutes bacterium]|nr:hypothetical protein [Bacillota bacterium]
MENLPIGQVLWRMAAIFIVALVAVRLMGNRTVGQYSPFDFVLMVGVGDIVGNVSMDRTESLFIGVEALVGIFLLQQILARLSLKSTFFRKWFEGTPVVLVQNGIIMKENMTKAQFNYDDLRQELHKFGMDFTNLKDIKVARLESCGDFSVVKFPEAEAITMRDAHIFMQEMQDNPLSQAGVAWSKLEVLAANMEEISGYIKSMRNAETSQTTAPLQPNENLH